MGLACLLGDGRHLAGVPVAFDHPFGLLADHADDAGHASATGTQRRVGERPECLAQRAITVHHQRHVLETAACTAEGVVDSIDDVGPDVRPDVFQSAAHGAVQLAAQHRQVGIVEEERLVVAAPCDPQRLRRIQDHRQQSAKFGRSVGRVGGTGPVAVLQQSVGELIGCRDRKGEGMHGRARRKVPQLSRGDVIAPCTAPLPWLSSALRGGRGGSWGAL